MEGYEEDDVLSFLAIHDLKSTKHSPKPARNTKKTKANVVSSKVTQDQAKNNSLYSASRTTVLFSDDDDFLESELSTATSKQTKESQGKISIDTKNRTGKSTREKKAGEKKVSTMNTSSQNKRPRKENASVPKPPKQPTKKPRLSKVSLHINQSQLTKMAQTNEDEPSSPVKSTCTTLIDLTHFTMLATKKSLSKFTSYQWDKDSPQKKRTPKRAAKRGRSICLLIGIMKPSPLSLPHTKTPKNMNDAQSPPPLSFGLTSMHPRQRFYTLFDHVRTTRLLRTFLPPPPPPLPTTCKKVSLHSFIIGSHKQKPG